MHCTCTRAHTHKTFSKTPKRQQDWFGLINLMCNSPGIGPTIPQENKGTRKGVKKESSHPPKQGFLFTLDQCQHLSSARSGSVWLIGWTSGKPGYLASDLFLIATRCSNHFRSLLLTQRRMYALHRGPLPVSPALQIFFFFSIISTAKFIVRHCISLWP